MRLLLIHLVCVNYTVGSSIIGLNDATFPAQLIPRVVFSISIYIPYGIFYVIAPLYLAIVFFLPSHSLGNPYRIEGEHVQPRARNIGGRG